MMTERSMCVTSCCHDLRPLRSHVAGAHLPNRTVFQDWCQASFYCWVPMVTAATGYESEKVQTGTGEPFMVLIDKLHVISENKRQLNRGLLSMLIEPLKLYINKAKGRGG